MSDTPIPPRITRRTILKGAAAGAVAVPVLHSLAGVAFAGPKDAPAPAVTGARAKSVIEIWMSGGPCHIDTWDPKPEAGSAYCGPFTKTADTKIAGMRLAEPMALLAAQADKFSLIRSLSHGIDGHETATYATQTGRKPGEDGLVYPGVGSIVSVFRGYDHGYKGLIPPYIVLTSPLGRFNETGFLGVRYKPFVTGGDPRARRFAVDGVVTEGISDERQKDRRDLLGSLDLLGKAVGPDATFKKYEEGQEKAYDLILGDAGKVFDLGQEKDEVRDRYGRTVFGQSCLAARRLVEKGVPYVTVHTGGWDTHRRHFESMRQRLPDLDRGLAALISDLHERGLLSQTIVWACGEFGRTPRVATEEPWNGGRHHFGRCFGALVAGGGFKGGVVVGASDPRGENVKDRLVRPSDLLGSIYTLMGIDPAANLPNPRGLDVRVMPATDPASKGMLKEIM